MRRLLTTFGLVLTLSATGVATVTAGPPSALRLAPASDHALGMVPVVGLAKGARPTRTSNLLYNGGPVMHGNVTYAIFWNPDPSKYTWGDTTGNPTYVDTVTQYFKDVAADSTTGSTSAKTSNVYYSDTQYGDTTGTIPYTSVAGGAFVDTTPYPPSGCTDKATSICLADGQLRTELGNVMKANGWSTSIGGVQNLFFIFTPKGVGSCISGTTCAYTTYCAYHWAIAGSNADGSDSILYAIQPYGAQSYRIYTCDSGQHPNNTTADATLNLVSHEHNETITDELGNAWYDSSGNENGDKCAWNFGTALGTQNGAKYNQTINGNHYYLQQEWSNNSSGCVLTGQ